MPKTCSYTFWCLHRSSFSWLETLKFVRSSLEGFLTLQSYIKANNQLEPNSYWKIIPLQTGTIQILKGTNETVLFQKEINEKHFIGKYKSLFNFRCSKEKYFFSFIEIDWYTCGEKLPHHLIISQLIFRSKCEHCCS